MDVEAGPWRELDSFRHVPSVQRSCGLFLVLGFVKAATLSPHMSVPMCIPTYRTQALTSPTPTGITAICFLSGSHSDRHEKESQSCFILHFLDDSGCWTPRTYWPLTLLSGTFYLAHWPSY